VKIGFIGTGNVARHHFEALEKIKEVRIVACTDVDAERAAQAAARFPGASSHTDVRRMLDEEELDAAYICVPPHAHGEIELALIERGIPFFIEKPIGRDRETPRRILAALDGTDLLTSVGYMFRYRSTAQKAREHLQQEAPVIARGGWIGGIYGVPWWIRKQTSGGQHNEQTTHVFDLARFLFGEVLSVFCKGRRGLITDVEGYDIEDASICTLTFESGLVCEISSSCASKMGDILMDVFTRNSRLKLTGWNLNLEMVEPGKSVAVQSAEDIFEVEDEIFVQAIKSGDRSKILCPYQDGVKTQMVVCAANESMDCGEPVAP